MKQFVLKNWKTSLIGVLILALAVYVWYGKATLSEAVSGFMALSAAGFFMSRDAKTKQQAEADAKNISEEIKDEVKKTVNALSPDALANRSDELTAKD